MGGFSLLLIFLVLGEGVHALGVPMPGNVLGMLLLTGALSLGLVRRIWIEAAVRFLLDNMALFFVPAGVGLIAHVGMLRGYWAAVSFAVVFSFLVVLYTSGLSYRLLSGKKWPPGRSSNTGTSTGTGPDKGSGDRSGTQGGGYSGKAGLEDTEDRSGHSQDSISRREGGRS